MSASSASIIDESTTFVIRRSIDDFQSVLIPETARSVVASGVGLKSLKGLPEHIVNLDISNNDLTDLKFCPKNLKNLRASKNKIQSLVDIADSQIENLGISYNHLHNFKGAPKTLKSVVAVSNFITSLEGLPDVMKKLYVSYNKIQSMMYCPAVDILDCSCNLIESFAHISEGVKELIISNNPLTPGDLKLCPRTVELLRCSACNMRSLEGYPKTLKLIECLKNNIENFSNIQDDVKEIFSDDYVHQIIIEER